LWFNYIEYKTTETPQTKSQISIILSTKHIPPTVPVVSNWPGHRLMSIDCGSTILNTKQPKHHKQSHKYQLYFLQNIYR